LTQDETHLIAYNDKIQEIYDFFLIIKDLPPSTIDIQEFIISLKEEFMILLKKEPLSVNLKELDNIIDSIKKEIPLIIENLDNLTIKHQKKTLDERETSEEKNIYNDDFEDLNLSLD